jgi:hypothetical protein
MSMSGLERSDRKNSRDKKQRPGSGVDRVSNSLSTRTCSSCRLRCLLLGYAFCLWAFLSLDNFELDVIALLEALISLRLDGTIVDEHIRAVISADKAEALRVVEPFHFAFNSRHDPYSGRSLGYTVILWSPRTSFSFSWFCHCYWEGRGTPEIPSHDVTRLIPVTLALFLFCAS